jgi:hypothetical protein
MMLRGFAVVASGVAQMLGCFLVVLRCFIRHEMFPRFLLIGLAHRQMTPNLLCVAGQVQTLGGR